MRLRVWILLLLANVLLGQTQTDRGAVSGTVRELSSGAPVAGAKVVIGSVREDAGSATTDAEGRFSITNVPAGLQRIAASVQPPSGRGFPVETRKMVTVAPGQEARSIELAVTLPGEIAGKVVDQNKEPLPGISVILVAREYSLGALRHVYAGMARTDDQGEYTMSVKAGRAFLLMAQKREMRIDSVSKAPADVKLRKQAMVTTFYPGAANAQGSQPLILRPGERREGVDLRMLRMPSYCVEAVAKGPSGPEAMRFQIEDQQATSGASGDGAMFVVAPFGQTAEDGKIRVCDLYPGEYQLTVSSGQSGIPQSYSSTTVAVFDRDVRNVTLAARPLVAVATEILWDGEAPDPPSTDPITVSLRPMTRAPWGGENNDVKSAIPGTFSFPSVLIDSYSVQVNGVPESVYIKEMTYAGQNVRAEPLRAGAGMGDSTLRIVLARDGGTVSATVADKDGNAVADARVLVMPNTVASEAALAAAILSGQCDQNGAWKSRSLAPGKYHVVALARPHDNSPESIGKLWASRTHFKEIELTPKGSAQVALTPMALD